MTFEVFFDLAFGDDDIRKFTTLLGTIRFVTYVVEPDVMNDPVYDSVIRHKEPLDALEAYVRSMPYPFCEKYPKIEPIFRHPMTKNTSAKFLKSYLRDCFAKFYAEYVNVVNDMWKYPINTTYTDSPPRMCGDLELAVHSVSTSTDNDMLTFSVVFAYPL